MGKGDFMNIKQYISLCEEGQREWDEQKERNCQQRQRLQSARPKRERQLYFRRTLSCGCILIELCQPSYILRLV